ncbi:uncharacterized protein [Linepithema humile]|uniref:uncharacterized protein n=1 Tax=Linepithema humile TaxID=83485 RepID=UPI00351F4646
MESPTTPTMLLDTQLPVISENDLMDYTNDKELNPLNININIIWSKLLMLESESRKINKKLNLISIKFESLLHDTKIIKSKMISQTSSKMDADNMFSKKYETMLPAKTNEEFRNINVQLDNDIEFRSNFCEHLYRYVDFNSTLTKNITMLLKICITRDVAITYTATKIMHGKKIIKDEPFYTCIEDIFLQKEFKEEVVSRNHLIKALSAALSNAKDWEGHRKDRIK